jgi:hypothetical protein
MKVDIDVESEEYNKVGRTSTGTGKSRVYLMYLADSEVGTLIKKLRAKGKKVEAVVGDFLQQAFPDE